MNDDKMYCKVLIIDDEYIMRQGIKHMLEWEKEGFCIVGEAADGKEGLALVEKLKPHIVLVDIVMPVLDGMDFTAIMKKRFPQSKIIILSSYDRFEYVKTALLNGASDYVLKPSLNPEKLLGVLQKTTKLIPNLQMKKDEELSVQEKLSRKLGGYLITLSEDSFIKTFPHTQFRLLCSNQSILCNGHRELENEVYILLENYFADRKDITTTVLRIKEEVCCIVLNYRIKDEERVRSLIQQCMQELKSYQPTTFWVLGGIFHRLDEIQEAYTRVTNYFPMRFYHKELLVLEERNHIIISNEKRFAYEEYQNCLKFREFDSALDMLTEYMNHACKDYMDEYVLKNIAKNMIYNFIIEWEKVDNSLSGKKSAYFRTMDNAYYAEDFLKSFGEVIRELRTACKLSGQNEGSSIREICHYIREHYNKNLELAQLSQQFGYNYNYLSTYFNQQVKEGFSGYLNRVRIEKACELLKTSPKSIFEISILVGYSDHSYFCRVFKSLKKKTPSEFRRTEEM